MKKLEPFILDLENKISEFENGKTTTLLSSGKAAILQSILTLARAGDEIIVCENLRPEVHDLFNVLIHDMGIIVNFIKSTKANDYVAAISPRTRCIFIDIEGGYIPEAFEVERIAYVAHKNKIPLLVDASAISPFSFKPIDLGVDIVIRDFTILCGSEMYKGGSVTEAGNFEWRVCNIPLIKAGDPCCGNIRWAFDLQKQDSALAFTMRLNHVVSRILDTRMNYASAFIISKAVDFISLNLEQRCKNASDLAKLLLKSDKIAWVAYPTVSDTSATAKAYGKKFGPTLAFAFKGTKEESRQKAKIFLENLKTIVVSADTVAKRSAIFFSEDEKKDGLITYSRPPFSCRKENSIHFVSGIEDFKTIRTDVVQALKKV